MLNNGTYVQGLSLNLYQQKGYCTFVNFIEYKV